MSFNGSMNSTKHQSVSKIYLTKTHSTYSLGHTTKKTARRNGSL
jgi:hypothetical protein